MVSTEERINSISSPAIIMEPVVNKSMFLWYYAREIVARTVHNNLLLWQVNAVSSAIRKFSPYCLYHVILHQCDITVTYQHISDTAVKHVHMHVSKWKHTV